MKKKKVLTMLGAIALVGVIGVGSTFAYVTARTNEVVNTFTVGKVSFEGGLNGGLTESAVERYQNSDDWIKNHPDRVLPSDVKEGQYVDVDGAQKWTRTENAYKDLVANEEVLKDPTVHIKAESEDCWVFAKIVNPNGENLTITYNTDEWEDVTDSYKTAQKISDSIDYKVYATKNILRKSSSVQHSTIFTKVTVGDGVDGKTSFQPITVSACAVQAAGFTKNTDALAEVTFQTVTNKNGE